MDCETKTQGHDYILLEDLDVCKEMSSELASCMTNKNRNTEASGYTLPGF